MIPPDESGHRNVTVLSGLSTGDMLGSTRVVTNAAGGTVALHDYAPYGEDVSGYRPALWGVGDGVTQRFTGKERDLETASSAMPTGLDYFGAKKAIRYSLTFASEEARRRR